jgi:hypothetical protein
VILNALNLFVGLFTAVLAWHARGEGQAPQVYLWGTAILLLWNIGGSRACS